MSETEGPRAPRSGRPKVARQVKTAGGPKSAAQRQAHRVVMALAAAYPDAVCALDHKNPFELLAATILSAQCTDKRVNQVTPALFALLPTPADMAAAELSAIEHIVQSTGFFRAKSRHLQAMAAHLVAQHGGEVPRTLAELTALPGVARKTASVVLGIAFGLAEGIVVDTHVFRLARRLGLSQKNDVSGVERSLMAAIDPAEWIQLSTRLIAHGRAVCTARSPRCGECPLVALCPTAPSLMKGASKAKLRRPRSTGTAGRLP